MRVSERDTNGSRPRAEHATEAFLPARAVPGGEPVLHAAIFGAFRDVLDPKTLAEIYREFLAQTRVRLQALPCMQSGEELAKLAHTLKGTAGMLGANRIAARAAQLEHELTAEPDLELAAKDLATACAELQVALNREKVLL